MKRKLILASGSERRSRILTEAGIAHEVEKSGYPENDDHSIGIEAIVEHNAVKKAESVSKGKTDALIIGADTLVLKGSKIIGKPFDEQEAKSILRELSGSKIEVHTGMCLMDTVSGQREFGADISEISVRAVTEEDINKYFTFLGPYDKAGGFSIEGAGAMIFDDIKGSYFNILGLSLMRLALLFDKLSLDISDFMRI